MDSQFVENPIRIHQPGEIVPASVLDETMVEHLLAIFQSPTGDWWIAYNGDLLGYYPASLFTMLNGGACRSAWYGEVARAILPQAPAAGWPKIEMGSGEFAETGLLNAAHVRDPQYYDLTWAGVPTTEDPPFSDALTRMNRYATIARRYAHPCAVGQHIHVSWRPRHEESGVQMAMKTQMNSMLREFLTVGLAAWLVAPSRARQSTRRRLRGGVSSIPTQLRHRRP
jgi:hypothetical protein